MTDKKELVHKAINARAAADEGDFKAFRKNVDAITDSAHMDPLTEKRAHKTIASLFKRYQTKNSGEESDKK